MLTLADIDTARARIRDAIYYSPCPASQTLGELTGTRCHVKLENLQMTGSFKERGALTKLLALGPDERARGVITASAGNHGLAVAFHAQRLGIAATIVMPEWAPLIKVTRCRHHGATVVLSGQDYDEAYAEARRREAATGAVFVHPFDDPAVIAGQGTLGLELVEQVPDLDAVVLPVGGGGLIAGVGLAVKARAPHVEVIGVQAAALPAMRRALEAGGPTDLASAPTIADGIAVRRVGALGYELARRYVDEVVVVDEAEIANAILLLLEIEKTVVEGAAATTLAAVLNKKVALAGKRVVLVLSGGNIDVNILARVIEKGLVKDGRLVRLAVLLADRPGALARLCAVVAGQRANILEIGHNRAFTAARIGESEVVLTLETWGPEQIEAVVGALRAANYQVDEVTANRRKSV
ncbi:MAG TPA: threonine ammonia-lyase [Methylomirabilota bacterium]|nr:threonine ammonia-lyase [Methylomirabilota bacterium]